MITNHQTGECSLPDCFCHEAQRLESTSSAAISAPDFEHEWNEAPRAMRNYVEQSIAEYWYLRGQLAGELKSLTETTQVFREMAEQRGLRG